MFEHDNTRNEHCRKTALPKNGKTALPKNGMFPTLDKALTDMYACRSIYTKEPYQAAQVSAVHPGWYFDVCFNKPRVLGLQI